MHGGGLRPEQTEGGVVQSTASADVAVARVLDEECGQGALSLMS